MKVALFDFCDTIVSFQTANAFVEYAIYRFKSRRVFYLLYKLVNKTKLISSFYYFFIGHGASKRIPLLFLKGIEKNELERIAHDFYIERIRPNFIIPVLEQIKKLQAEGNTTIIVSGGYSIYIVYFAKEYGIDCVLANEILYRKNRCAGKYGEECMGRNKVARLASFLPLNEIDYLRSWAFTDDKSDVPLLELVQNKVVVSKGGHQDWAESLVNYEEIIFGVELK